MKDVFLLQSLHKLEELSGLEGRWTERHNHIDGILEITAGESRRKYQLPVILKPTATKAHLADLRKVQRVEEHLMVIAGKVSPGIRQQFREWKMGYLDSAGNMYLNIGDCFVFIDGQKDYPPAAREKRQLFTNTGIRIVFHLLASPQAGQQAYRELAETLDVSLGSITNAMQQLKQKGFLLKTGPAGWRLHEKEKLLKGWITAYAEKLKPGLLIGRFRFASPDQQWVDAKLLPGTFWGGEPAAFLLTNYMRPAEWTLYSSQDTRDLMKSLRLLPDENGNVWVYRKFWSEALIPHPNNTAPELLVYSDLLASGEDRNMETAQKLYDEAIKGQL